MSVAGLGESCACAHAEGLHHPAGPCAVTLPPFLEEELPAWRCPCARFRARPRGPWRWHEPTQSWALTLEPELFSGEQLPESAA